MEYSEETYLKANKLKFRFSLLNLINTCQSIKNEFVEEQEFVEACDWREYERFFIKILELYDSDKLSDDIYLKDISNIEELLRNQRQKNKISRERFLKLIKIQLL